MTCSYLTCASRSRLGLRARRSMYDGWQDKSEMVGDSVIVVEISPATNFGQRLHSPARARQNKQPGSHCGLKHSPQLSSPAPTLAAPDTFCPLALTHEPHECQRKYPSRRLCAIAFPCSNLHQPGEAPGARTAGRPFSVRPSISIILSTASLETRPRRRCAF